MEMLRRVNLFLSRFDEQQTRWYAAHESALESEKVGYGVPGCCLRSVAWIWELTEGVAM